MGKSEYGQFLVVFTPMIGVGRSSGVIAILDLPIGDPVHYGEGLAFDKKLTGMQGVEDYLRWRRVSWGLDPLHARGGWRTPTCGVGTTRHDGCCRTTRRASAGSRPGRWTRWIPSTSRTPMAGDDISPWRHGVVVGAGHLPSSSAGRW